MPRGALACPGCGADETTGWNDRATGQRLDLPDDEFNYDEFVQEEFGERAENRAKTKGVSWLWWIVALGLVLAFSYFAVLSLGTSWR